MGGAEKIEKQHSRGKLSARERIDKLFDAGTFLEIGIHGTQMMGARATPADACICGYGKIRGRDAAVIAYDFTVLGGSIGETGERKATRIREIALKERIPVIWLIDSAGARISPQDHVHGDQVSLFAGSGYLFKEQVIMSGVVPQVAAMVGPGAAGTAYIPGLADFVPMVKGTSSMALGGPPLVKAVVGEEISEEDLGGSKVHNEVSGVADLEVENDEACLEAVKEYLSFFPQHSGDKPERAAAPPADVTALLDEKFLSIVPDNPRQGYDMKKVIKGIVDDGRLFEMKPKWAKNLVTGFARIGGYPVGIVANNPMFLGGALDVNSADKAARFVWLCDAFNVPLLFLSDTPGFLIGSKMEQAGIIRHGAKMLYAVSEATVPKITVVVRKSYGAGYYVMCGRAYDPDMILAWPTGEISVMGAEGMAGIATKKLEGGDPAQLEAAKKGVVDMIKPLINIYKVAGWGLVDDVIDPRETRAKVFRALELTRNKTIERPRRKHGVIPV
ncbi:MAG TPA: acyl-CoA carboxylase subunit beta [bacterium]|nr:acyl-CoA carboxylase subunit beta [bacterium]